MYRCIECGHIFEEGEQTTWTETHGHIFGKVEHFSGCPVCNGEYEEVKHCIFCGEITDNKFEICDECFNSNITAKKCYEISNEEKENVSINMFIANVLSVEEIEKILLEHICSNNYEENIKNFVKEDEQWFIEKISKEA